jgi:putative transposase
MLRISLSDTARDELRRLRRRVNALAAYQPDGPRPRLDWWAAAKTWTSADLIAFLKELPWSAVPRVVVLDNAGLHTSKAVKAARPGLAKLGIYLYYLPPYSPELNRIEAVFRQIKYQGMPRRSHPTLAGLRPAVEQAFRDHRDSLAGKGQTELPPCAYS